MGFKIKMLDKEAGVRPNEQSPEDYVYRNINPVSANASGATMSLASLQSLFQSALRSENNSMVS